MDGKVFNIVEVGFIAVLLVVVLYLGGFFGSSDSPAPVATSAPTIPPPSPAATRIKITAIAPTRTPRPVAPTAEPFDYQIASGDTCIAIATRFDITLESLIKANGLDAECRILAGERLKIPALTPTIAP
jgi:LysM repeat protein